ncbi:MAG: asparaginase [Sarcina sp.]
MKKIAVIFNGGTISMKVDENIQAAVPTLTGEQIMAKVTGIERFAIIESHNFSTLPSPHITLDIMLELSREISNILERDDIDGVVVTHGTDTLEETSYLVDLTLNNKKPVVFTGAMRSSSELGYDGPANLAASICTASCDEAIGRGVLICFNGELNSAREVTKANSMALNAFRTPNFGPIGIVDDNKAIFYRNNSHADFFEVDKIEKKVAIVKCCASAEGDFIDFAVESGYKGIVLEALGRGNVPPQMVPSIQRALDKGIIIILTSRCFEGRVYGSYGYEGGGQKLHNMGVIFGESMPSQKARIKLLMMLNSGKNKEEIQNSFEKKYTHTK